MGIRVHAICSQNTMKAIGKLHSLATFTPKERTPGVPRVNPKLLLRCTPTENINIATHSVVCNFRLSKLSWLLPGSKSRFLLIIVEVSHSSSIFTRPYTEVSTF
jgi:hypothetical protein